MPPQLRHTGFFDSFILECSSLSVRFKFRVASQPLTRLRFVFSYLLTNYYLRLVIYDSFFNSGSVSLTGGKKGC